MAWQTAHLDCLRDIADCAGVQPNQPGHFSHNGLSVFKPAKPAVKGQHHRITKLGDNVHAKPAEIRCSHAIPAKCKRLGKKKDLK